MPEKQPKRLLIMNILDILSRYDAAVKNEWAMEQFVPVVIISEPQSLREQVKKDLEESLKYYQ